MLGTIELFDRDNDRLIKRFGNDNLSEALEYAKVIGFINGCIFQQEDEDGSLMFLSVDEVLETFNSGDSPADLCFF